MDMTLRCGDVIVIRGGVYHGYRALFLYRSDEGFVVWYPGRQITVAHLKPARGGW
jgi:hypothetical protein